MKLRILSLRRRTPKEVQTLEADYLKRIRKTLAVELLDIKPKSGARKSEEEGRREDARRIMSYLTAEDQVVVLDREGKAPTSEELAGWFKDHLVRGTARITFIVGSAEGLGAEVKKRAHFKLRLSNVTLPHVLARLILIEAVYRSFDILGRKTYHK